MNYIAVDNGDGTFTLSTTQDTTDINGNAVTILQTIGIFTPAQIQTIIDQQNADLANAQDSINAVIADQQARLDAISACQGGTTIQTQYQTILSKKSQVKS